jgi:hypothetical protein
MRRLVPPLCVAAVVAVISTQLYRRDLAAKHRPTLLPTATRCSGAQTALLGGLQTGDPLGAFRVAQITCDLPGRLDIEVARGPVHLILSVVPQGTFPHEPPRKTRDHHLFYSLRGQQLPAPELDQLLDLLTSKIEAAEKNLPAPPTSR